MIILKQKHTGLHEKYLSVAEMTNAQNTGDNTTYPSIEGRTRYPQTIRRQCHFYVQLWEILFCAHDSHTDRTFLVFSTAQKFRNWNSRGGNRFLPHVYNCRLCTLVRRTDVDGETTAFTFSTSNRCQVWRKFAENKFCEKQTTDFPFEFHKQLCNNL